jgi:hypothetical protein
MGWTWLTPLAVVFGFRLSNWLYIFNFFSYILIVGIFLTMIFYIAGVGDLYLFGTSYWFQNLPFLFLTFFYQNKKIQSIIIISFITFILLSIVISQRINIIYFSLLIIMFIFEMFRDKNINLYIKTFLLLVLISLTLFISFKVQGYIEKLQTSQELTSDTRTFLFIELFDDMSEEELWIGRGALGKYYSPYFYYTEANGLPGDSSTRSSVEVGYLEMILKGGYIMVLLYLLILLPAAYLGIFKSKNILARMSGYMIFIYIILWFISYIPIYSAEFILLWMATGTAISNSTRNQTNLDITTKKGGRFAIYN